MVVSYFLYLAGAAFAVKVPRWRRLRVVGVALLVVAAVGELATIAPSRSMEISRDWIPLAYILLAYWLPAHLVTVTDPALEQRLLAFDHRWFGRQGLQAFSDRAPRTLTEWLELTYLSCSPLIPAGLACLYWAGLRAEADRFWVAVLLAGLPCYGSLPWFATRPPRALEGDLFQRRSVIRAVNLQVLGRASVQLNTFPSGHAAASLATALTVVVYLPAAGLLLAVIAASISVASVVGRYHYAADALTGVGVALIAFVLSRL